MINIKFPDGENVEEHLDSALKVSLEMEKLFKKNEKIILNFSETSWFMPCSIIVISNKILELLKKDAKISFFEPKDPKTNSHLKKIGFPLGSKLDGSSYVPLNHFEKREGDKKQVNKEVNELLEKMEGKIPYSFGSSICYILGELSDNIDDHSNFKFASLMAQYYPTKKMLDIAVFDNGASIPGVFENNNISFTDDAHAIEKAVSGKISTKKGEEMRAYGLRTCKKLSIEGIEGEMYIISRKGLIHFQSNEEYNKYLLNLPLSGTFLYFRLKTPKKLVNWTKYVE